MEADGRVVYKLGRKDYVVQDDLSYFGGPEIIHLLEADESGCKAATRLKYFKLPCSYPLNLNAGFEYYQFRSETYYNENCTKIENYIMSNENGSASKGYEGVVKCKIYTTRGLLWKLMAIPYQAKRSFTFLATKVKGEIYISCDKCSLLYKSHSVTDTYHFKLRQYCFSDSPETDPVTDVNLNENEQSYCIYKAKWGDMELLYSAEVQGAEAKKKIRDLSNMDEINTCKFVTLGLFVQTQNQRKWQTHPKWLKYCYQAFLSNVNDMYIAFRDEDGYVHEPLKHVKREDIQNQNSKWDLLTSLNFANTILNKVRTEMSDVNCPHTVYEFNYVPDKKSFYCKVHSGKNNYSILSDEFIKFLNVAA